MIRRLTCGSAWLAAALLLATLGGPIGCQAAEEPGNVQILILRGDAYQRGLQQGQQLSAHIRSLYTRLLTASIMPFLNREQLNIAPILNVYNQPEYLDGQFSYRMLLESGQNLYDNFLPEHIRQELQGIADGAGMSLDQVIVLNTFFDTMMAFRAVVLFIQNIQEPYLASFAALDGLDADGQDNDGDGQTDEADEGQVTPYQPLPHAILVEVPTDVRIRFTIEDPTLPGLACADPRNVEPLADLQIERRCVLDECLRRECRDREMVDRECFDPPGLVCLEPRVPGACLDPVCMESSDPGCVNPDSVRITMDDWLFTAADDAIQTRQLPLEPPDPDAADCAGPLEVTFAPPGGFQPASLVSLVIQAGDQSPVYSPAPLHNRYMRDERIVFTTAGYAAASGTGRVPYQVANAGTWEERERPPPISFAVRGSATPSGDPLLAHHFALLDSDMVHEHSALLVHVPDDGEPYALLTWTGLTWGFSGMNAHGLTYAINHSDTLDNPLVGGVLEEMFKPENLAKLMLKPDLEGLAEVLAETYLYQEGIPAGMMGRELLSQATTVDEGLELLYRTGRTYGWNLLLADAAGDMIAVETDAATQAEQWGQAPAPQDEDGFAFYTPDDSRVENLDAHGRRLASVGPDDLRMASHFVKNAEDMVDLDLLSTFAPRKQRVWSGFYYKSLRAFFLLGEQIAGRYGAIDVVGAAHILRTPTLVDRQDSMNACIYEPAAVKMHWAMGGAPATDQPFVEFDLGAVLAAEGGP